MILASNFWQVSHLSALDISVWIQQTQSDRRFDAVKVRQHSMQQGYLAESHWEQSLPSFNKRKGGERKSI